MANILVVDDERGIREGCRRILAAEGYLVDQAEDGKQGLALLQQKTYDLMLVDLMMPVMGGLELMDAIQQQHLDVLVIVITGYATIETAVEAMKHGAYDYIPKPFSPDQLLAVVNRGLERQRLRRQTQHLLEERDRRLLEIVNEKSKLLTIVNSMADGVLVINRELQLVLWNPMALKMLNLSQQPEHGQHIQQILPQPELVQLILQATAPDASKYTTISEEIEMAAPTPHTLMANISVVRDDNGDQLGVVSILRDITSLKEIDRLKSQFVSMVAHELRAPLSAIEGFLSAYLSGAAGSNAEFNRQMLERAKQRAHALLELVNDLLQIARLESQRVVRKKELLDIGQIIGSVIGLFEMQARERGIKLKLDLPPSCPPLEADRSEMEQLFSNLVSNAIKYNVDQGTVTIHLEANNDCLKIEVSDSGIGIDEADVPHIFDDFYRVNRPETRYITGTGLGLSIVKKIVESHFGRIDVQSRLNQGTTFVIKFPLRGIRSCS
ncbi:MAG: response regulator [candidate division KSB1 bacterium]|nr:response regulator [candidate division KSB1 bacterium]MDZ7318570.1 response regulator [candidate division KSB1 bacterium]MDZ7340820.1 response regulator [candidate division KSB1 bacterium]